jgi:hypothetical protein
VVSGKSLTGSEGIMEGKGVDGNGSVLAVAVLSESLDEEFSIELAVVAVESSVFVVSVSMSEFVESYMPVVDESSEFDDVASWSVDVDTTVVRIVDE